MNSIKSAGVLIAAITLMCPAVDGANMHLSFDGIVDGGWTISNQPPGPGPVPITDLGGMGLNAIAFNDAVAGVAYYNAPASLTSLDMTGESLSFNFWINEKDSTLVDDDTAADLMINGIGIALDVIDESQLDTLQAITVDFSDPAFDGVDLSNITSLGIRAEFWSNGGERMESYLVSVPEPASFSLAALCSCGLLLLRRRK